MTSSGVFDYTPSVVKLEPMTIPIGLKSGKSINSTVQEQLNAMNNLTWSKTPVKVNVRFKASSFLPLKRSPTYTYTDFIASCGGLFGLFMGMSLLSIIEIFYFFTIRICSRKKYSVGE